MKDELKQQFALRISQANKTELCVILYEMFQTYVEDAIADLAKEDVKTFRVDIQRARGCLKELMGSLHFEYEPAPTLLKIYIYVSKLLVTADLHNDVEPLKEANVHMGSLHDAFAKLSAENSEGPVMGNAQTVYAGLTYGKNDLNVSMDQGDGKRGYFA